MNPLPGDQTPSEDRPRLCWNRRRRYGAAAALLLLAAIPVKFAYPTDLFGFLGFLIGVFGVIIALWLVFKQVELGINRKPDDCRYARVCDIVLALAILWLNVILQGIDVGT